MRASSRCRCAAPDVNRSSADFDVAWTDGQGAVLYALGAIRNVGLEAMQHVVEVRETGGRFTDIFDFLERVDPRSVNKRALEGLAKAGAFDSIHSEPAPAVRTGRHPDGLLPERGGRAGLVPGVAVRRRSGRGGAAASEAGRALGRARSGWIRNCRRSASICPAIRWRTWRRRCGASA